MMRWCSVALGAFGPIFCYGTQALAQDAAKPNDAAGSGTLTTLLILAPAALLFFFMISMMSRAKKASAEVTRSLQLGEESVALAREQVALQRETNRLLAQLIGASGSH